MKRLIVLFIVLMLCACTPRGGSSSGHSSVPQPSSSSSSASVEPEPQPQPQPGPDSGSSSEGHGSSSSAHVEPQPSEQHVVTTEYMTLGETGIWIKENGLGALGGIYNLGIYRPSDPVAHEKMWEEDGIADYFSFLRGLEDRSAAEDKCFEMGKDDEFQYYLLFVPVDEDEMVIVNRLSDGKVLYQSDDGKPFIITVPEDAKQPLLEIQMAYGERVTYYQPEVKDEEIVIPPGNSVVDLGPLYTMIRLDQAYFDELYYNLPKVKSTVEKGGSLFRSGRTWIDGEECVFYILWDKDDILTCWYAVTVEDRHVYECSFADGGYWVKVK